MDPKFLFLAFLYAILVAAWWTSDPVTIYLRREWARPPIRVAFVTIATKPAYYAMAADLMHSLEKHWCRDQRDHFEPTFIVFSDQPGEPGNFTMIYQDPLPWPQITLQRFDIMLGQKFLLGQFDYVAWMDSDQLAVDDFCTDILGERVALSHCWFPNSGGYPYEQNGASTAFVDRTEEKRNRYYSAHFFAGKSTAFLELLQTCAHQVSADSAKGIIANYHDESHLNRALVSHPPTVVLTHSFTCFSDRAYNTPGLLPDDIREFSKRHKCMVTATWNAIGHS